MDEHVVIVGAGPAGLAAAWAIRRAGHDPLVVEQADVVAASWRGRHDHLRLNTHRAFSHQPGARIPRRCGPYPARDDYAAYLQEYSAGMRLRLGTRVHRIDRTDEGWMLALDRGSLTTAHVVIATGSDAEPVLPDWPGLASFGGTVIHAGQESRRWPGTWSRSTGAGCPRSPAPSRPRSTRACGSSAWTAASTATCTSAGARPASWPGPSPGNSRPAMPQCPDMPPSTASVTPAT
jgi:putative flavoprotein involved in K+ transport